MTTAAPTAVARVETNVSIFGPLASSIMPPRSEAKMVVIVIIVVKSACPLTASPLLIISSEKYTMPGRNSANDTGWNSCPMNSISTELASQHMAIFTVNPMAAAFSSS